MKSIIEPYLTNNEFGIKNISVLLRNKNKCEKYNVKDNELYDIASITKIFTLKLIHELLKEKIITKELNVMPDYTVLDVLKMKGHLGINKKLKESQNKQEFKKNLDTIYVIDKIGGEYTDLGLIKLQFLVEKITGLTYKELMNKYVLRPLNLNNTMYNPINYNLFGNGNKKGLPHDPKTRIIDGVSAAAGIFTNAEDLNKISLSKDFFDNEFLNEILNYEFLDAQNRRRSYCGIYLNTANNSKSYVPMFFSENAYAHQGYTGSIVVFDEDAHISILVDAIKDNSLLKSENYFEYFHQLKTELFNYLEQM